MGLTEAFARTDDNGGFIPRTRPTLGERDGAVSDSRIPRTRTFSPEAAKGSPSPSRADRPAYILNGREGRAVSMPTVDYESEDTGAVRQTSPSPRPRDHRGSGKDSGSDVSNRSLLYDDEYFEKKRIKAEKNRAYIQKAVSDTKPLFHGRAGSSKVMETTRTLERKTSESSLDDREPPIRIPTTWGSRASKNRGWMRKILSPDTSFELKDPVEAPEVADRPRTAPDELLPSVENRSLPQEITPPASRPASAQPMNASPEKMWDADLDFTARSLQISTSPQLRVKSKSRLDEIRSREIQNLTARAVATNRLEEIRERNLVERSVLSEPTQSDTKDLAPKQEPAPEEYHERTILEEEGEKIPFTPITVFSKRKDFDDYVKRNNITFSRSNSSSSSGSRPRVGHRRDESRELLRRLSRSISSSPGPSKTEEKGENPNRSDPVDISEPKKEAKNEKPNRSDPEKHTDAQKEKIVEEPDRSDPVKHSEANKEENFEEPTPPDAEKHSRTHSPAIEVDDPEERIAAEARLFDLQDKSEKGSIRTPSPLYDGQLDETPRPKPDPLLLPTPKVTGAYIETPFISKISRSRSRSPRSKTTDIRPQTRLTDSRPPLINTAKHVSAIEDVRRIQLETKFEDSTLDDLDFLEGQVAAEGTTTIEPILDLEYNDHGLPLSQKEIERRIEEVALERMNKSLKATTTSIRDARKGIERLEEQVSSSFINVAQTQPNDGTAYIKVKIPIPKLWTSQPPTKPGMRPGWKLTWLGFMLSLLASWYALESAMCAQFCHPKNSRVNTWQPSDPFFPWAIPTKLDQWTGEIVSTGLGSVTGLLGIQGAWDLGIPQVPSSYTGGPIGASDWWLGRNGPVGIRESSSSSFGDDEMI